LELELPFKCNDVHKEQQESTCIAVVELWLVTRYNKYKVPSHYIIKFHKVAELYHSRKVRIVCTEQLCCLTSNDHHCNDYDVM